MFHCKRGEVSSGFLISVIIVVVSFALILWFFIGQFNWTGTIDKEVCKESVILRAASPDIGNVKNLIPLRCQTKKICVGGKGSDFFGGKADCEDSFANTKGVQKKNVKDKTYIEKLIADEMVEAWETLGEGKVDIYPVDDPGFLQESHCVIYSRIAFDIDSLEDKGINLSFVDVNLHMKQNQGPIEGKSYYDYFSENNQEVKLDLIELPCTGHGCIGKNVETEPLSKDSSKNVTKEIAIVFMQFSEEGFLKSIGRKIRIGGTVASGSFMFAPAIAKGTFSTVGLGVATLFTIYESSDAIINHYRAPAYCGDLDLGGADPSYGCSVVRVIEYTPESINKYCTTIDSIV